MGWHWTDDSRLREAVDERNAQTFLPFDLFTGRVGADHPFYPALVNAGAPEEQLAWLRQHPSQIDVLGINLYPWGGGRWDWGADRHVGELNGGHMADVLRYVWNRYRVPMMITETSARSDVPGRARWMDDTIASVAAVRAEGIPIVGYTWFPMMTMIDWEYRLSSEPLEKYLLHLGLWDSAFDAQGVLQRHPTPLVERYRAYVAQGAPTVRPAGPT